MSHRTILTLSPQDGISGLFPSVSSLLYPCGLWDPDRWVLSISTGLPSIGAGLQHGVFAGYSLSSGSRRQLEPLSESSGVTPSRFPVSVDAGKGQHFWRHTSRAKPVCDHLRAGIKGNLNPAPPGEKKQTDHFPLGISCLLPFSFPASSWTFHLIYSCMLRAHYRW